MPNYRIVVEIDPKRATAGSRAVRSELTGIERQANSLRTALTRAFAFAGITVGIGGLVQLADQYTNIQNRLRTVTDGTEELGAVTKELLGIANATRSSFQATAELYTRTSLAARELGLSQRQTLEFTESLNQAVILSGASAAEASAGMIQLSQGLASGTLRGDELRSVLEQLPAVADVIAQELGVTRGELRKMGEDGKITSDIIITAFANAREELGERFAKTVPTLGQSFEVLRNNLVNWIGELTTSSGLVANLSSLILALANNLDNIIPLIVAAGAAFGAWQAAATVSAILGPMIALERALGASSVAAALFSISLKGVQGAINGVTAAIAANPIGALAVAITAVISLLYIFSDDIKVSADGVVTLGDVFVATGELILESISAVTDFLMSAWDTAVEAVNSVLAFFGTTFSEVMSFVGNVIKLTVNLLIGTWVGAFNAIRKTWDKFPAALGDLFVQSVNKAIAAINFLIQKSVDGINWMVDQANSILPEWAQLGRLAAGTISEVQNQWEGAAQDVAGIWRDEMTSAMTTDYIGDAWQRIMDRARQRALARGAANDNVDLDQTGPRTAPMGTEDDDKGKKKAKAREERDIFADWVRDTEQEIKLLGMTNRERERAQEIYQLENQLKRALTQTEKELADALLDELQAMRDARYLRDYSDDLRMENDILRDLLPGHEARAEALKIERDLGRELTPVERQRVIDLNEENRALQIQKDIYDQLNGRREEAIEQLREIGTLLEDGKISAADARIARAGIGLVQDLNNLDQDLGGQFQFQAELDNIQLLEDERMRIVQDALDARLLVESEAAARRVEIEADTQRRIRELQVAQQSVAIQAAQSTAESLASIAKDLGGEQSRIYRAMFVASKAFAIADSIVKIQQGVANALSLPFPANLAAAATVAAQAASIVSNIRAVTMQFAEGGLVSGPGTGTSDSITARLSDGEYVVNAKATAANLGLLEAINSGKDPFMRYAEGGLATNDNDNLIRPSRPASEIVAAAPAANDAGRNAAAGAIPAPVVNQRIINVLDPAIVGDYLATPDGEQMIVNVINNNPEVVRRAAGGS